MELFMGALSFLGTEVKSQLDSGTHRMKPSLISVMAHVQKSPHSTEDHSHPLYRWYDYLTWWGGITRALNVLMKHVCGRSWARNLVNLRGPDPREVSKGQMIWSVLGHSLKSERKVAFLLLPTAQNWTALGGSLWRQHMPYLKCLPQSIYWKIYQTVDFKWGLEQVSWALWTSVMVIEMSVSNRDIVWGFWPIKLENYNVKISVWWAKHVTCCIQLSFKD